MKITVDVTPKQVLESATQLELGKLVHAFGMPHWAGHAAMVRGLARAAVLLEQERGGAGIWDDDARNALERARSIGLVSPRVNPESSGPVAHDQNHTGTACDVQTCPRHETKAPAALYDSAMVQGLAAAAALASAFVPSQIDAGMRSAIEHARRTSLLPAPTTNIKIDRVEVSAKARIELLTNADAER